MCIRDSAGTVKSSVGLGALLLDGIGDTIRISLAADPAEEARVGWDLLKSLRLRSKGIHFIACPSCSRQNFDVIETVNALEARLEDIKVPMDVSIIGCIVNGPGEAKESDFMKAMPMDVVFGSMIFFIFISPLLSLLQQVASSERSPHRVKWMSSRWPSACVPPSPPWRRCPCTIPDWPDANHSL